MQKAVKKRKTVSLNLKDPEAHRLAEAISQQTGETLSRVVVEALRQRHERLCLSSHALGADIRAIARRASAHIHRPYLDHADYLYDQHGLPK